MSGTTGDIQTWDEGVGQDYYKGNGWFFRDRIKETFETDNSFSDRPVNWFERSQSINGVKMVYMTTQTLVGNGS